MAALDNERFAATMDAQLNMAMRFVEKNSSISDSASLPTDFPSLKQAISSQQEQEPVPPQQGLSI